MDRRYVSYRSGYYLDRRNRKMQCSKEFVFEGNAPFAECHASTLLLLPGEEVLAAWFGGTKEGTEDVMIWLSRRTAGIWSVPQCVTKEVGIPHWNPVLFLQADGTVVLYYKIGHRISTWKTMVMESRDLGHTWSEARELVPGDEGGRGPVKNKAIYCSDGRILAPASIEQGPWRCFVDISADGVQWQKHPIPVSREDVNMIQPSLWEWPMGEVHGLLRTNAGFIYRTDSADFGETWSTAYAIDIPNNNSGLDGVHLGNGRIALVCNPVEKDWGPRSPLTLFLSEDNGITFQKWMDLETEPGEYSYPAILSDGKMLHICYTWNRKRIAYWQIRI